MALDEYGLHLAAGQPQRMPVEVPYRIRDRLGVAVDVQAGLGIVVTPGEMQAMWAFKALSKADPQNDVAALMLLLAQDEGDERAQRDKTIKIFPPGKGPLQWLPVAFRETLDRGEMAKMDLKAADDRIAGMRAPLQPIAAYFVGRFLEQRGHKDDAIQYYRRSVSAPEADNIIFPTLAVNRLRSLGVNDLK